MPNFQQEKMEKLKETSFGDSSYVTVMLLFYYDEFIDHEQR